MSADPIGDALRADAEDARIGIRGLGVACPSCGKNMADLPREHSLEFSGGTFPASVPDGTAKCAAGNEVALGELAYDGFKAVANIAVWDDVHRREDEAFARIIGKREPGHEYTGLLDVLGGPA